MAPSSPAHVLTHSNRIKLREVHKGHLPLSGEAQRESVPACFRRAVQVLCCPDRR